MNEAGEGIRLAKRVAAARGCSRREAEALIFSGAVQVDGQVVTDPARRIRHETLSIDPVAPDAAGQPLTLLLHQGAETPVRVDTLADLVATAQPAPPWRAGRLARLQPLLTLPAGALGLCVFSDDPSVVRHLQDPRAPLEQEWLATVAGPLAPEQLSGLQHPGLRISLNQQTPDHAVLRVAGKAASGEGFARWLADRLPLCGLRRQRIGRLGLAPLATGQWRALLPGERF